MKKSKHLDEIPEELREKIAAYKNFLIFWNDDLRPHCEACVKEGLPLYVRLVESHDDKTLSDKEKTGIQNDIYEESIKLGIRDFIAVHQIVNMIQNVIRAMERMENPSLAMLPVYNALSQLDYYDTVFGGDDANMECVNLKMLHELIKTSFDMLKTIQ